MPLQPILHIPHASCFFPHFEGYTVSRERLAFMAAQAGDLFTDDLFICEGSIPIIAPFSRIFCDTERFEDDALEPMSKLGHGCIYTHGPEGDPIRTVSPALREHILDGHYRPHHLALEQAVEQQLALHGRALIIDCHSFPDQPFSSLTPKTEAQVAAAAAADPSPDFCIGADPHHTAPELTSHLVHQFYQRGFSVSVNSPYSGSLVPLKFYRSDPRVLSIMIEVNRKLILTPSGHEKSANFPAFQQLIQGLYPSLCAVAEVIDWPVQSIDSPPKEGTTYIPENRANFSSSAFNAINERMDAWPGAWAYNQQRIEGHVDKLSKNPALLYIGKKYPIGRGAPRIKFLNKLRHEALASGKVELVERIDEVKRQLVADQVLITFDISGNTSGG